jgi:hypothetical protein
MASTYLHQANVVIPEISAANNSMHHENNAYSDK